MSGADPFAWRTSRVSAAGTTVVQYEAGCADRNARIVVLVHGLGHWTEAAWGSLVPLLDPALRYLAFDLPGFGASEKPDVRYDARFFARVVDDVVAGTGAPAVAVVGHSLGGYIAAEWAAQRPERVSHLALIAPAGFARVPRFFAYAVLARAFGSALGRVTPSRAFVERALRRALADPATLDPEHLERSTALAREFAYRRAFGGVYSAALEGFFRRAEMHRRFARYTGPVFCAWGRADRYITCRGLEVVRRVYPHARTLMLERSGHLPMLEQPHELAGALRAFLAPSPRELTNHPCGPDRPGLR